MRNEKMIYKTKRADFVRNQLFFCSYGVELTYKIFCKIRHTKNLLRKVFFVLTKVCLM